ncbi:MAG: hypothetical protein ISS76_09500 [Phycisphaerae bacterium]|nr:hypothetical protein [Phycisphaerae bacterium]
MVRFHQEQNALTTLGLYRKSLQIDLSVIEKNNSGQITGYLEKPTIAYDVSMGIYVFEPAVLKYIPENKSFDLPDLVRLLISQGERVADYQFDGEWLDIGRKDDYSQAVELFNDKRSLFLPDQQQGQPK